MELEMQAQNSDRGGEMDWLWLSFYHALAMLWATFWALVLGFTISGVLQVFVSKEQMSRTFGRTSLKSVAIATGLGAASSSCSYAAVAAARSAIQQGAALVPALAFMFASTNLVIELGAILWVLMGWQFVLAEVVGAFLLIIFMWLLIRLFLPKHIETEIRAKMTKQEAKQACHSSHSTHLPHVAAATTEHEHKHDRGKWIRVSHAFVADWSMLWKEILAGFLIAGFLATLVPHDWWEALFLQNGPAVVRLIENALVGPFIAVISFVCSVGNIPLASLLWAHGISFGGVISFIYADLLVIPILLIYAKYYGVRAAAWITGIFYVAMVLAGISVDLVFTAFGLIPQGSRPPSAIEHAHIIWNYTSWLDLIALIFAAWLLILHFRSRGERHHACH
ncbi:MAG: hypothetical protein DMF40_06895 [Verrucomicrobia bacterium]|nr:MAG: hypothetical protein DMF40_06895 [Verrucomicrobiota bacterium]